MRPGCIHTQWIFQVLLYTILRPSMVQADQLSEGFTPYRVKIIKYLNNRYPRIVEPPAYQAPHAHHFSYRRVYLRGGDKALGTFHNVKNPHCVSATPGACAHSYLHPHPSRLGHLATSQVSIHTPHLTCWYRIPCLRLLDPPSRFLSLLRRLLFNPPPIFCLPSFVPSLAPVTYFPQQT